MIRVFSMKAGGTEFSDDRWNGYLTEDRKKLTYRRKDERERQLFLGAEILLNKSLELTGVDVSIPAKYKRNEHGKPYLTDCDGIYVNWSHSGEYVICAVADQEVGIDLQYAGKKPGDKLVNKVLQPEEKLFYEKMPQEEQQRLFYEYWAVKESFLKTLGTGFYTPLDQFYVEFEVSAVSKDLNSAGNRYARIIQKINEKKYCCRLLNFADPEYMAAVCVEGGRAHAGTISNFERLD